MFRVDRRAFNIYDTILPAETSYQESADFNLDKQKIEMILSEEQPIGKKANRKSGLYIFADLSDAIRFCCVMSKSRIYRVTALNDTDCYHRGDMNWTEIMNEFLNNDQALKAMARLYWQGEKTFKPCWEMLVNKIQVTNIIITNENARNNLYRAYHEKSGNLEQMDFYIETLKRQ
jgi:hypothetical protein